MSINHDEQPHRHPRGHGEIGALKERLSPEQRKIVDQKIKEQKHAQYLRRLDAATRPSPVTEPLSGADSFIGSTPAALHDEQTLSTVRSELLNPSLSHGEEENALPREAIPVQAASSELIQNLEITQPTESVEDKIAELKRQIAEQRQRANKLHAEYFSKEGKLEELRAKWGKGMKGIVFDFALGNKAVRWWNGVDAAQTKALDAAEELEELKVERDALLERQFRETRQKHEEADREKAAERLAAQRIAHQQEDAIPVTDEFRQEFGQEVADAVDYFNYVGREEEIGIDSAEDNTTESALLVPAYSPVETGSKEDSAKEKDPNGPSGFGVIYDELTLKGRIFKVKELTEAQKEKFIRDRADALGGKGGRLFDDFTNIAQSVRDNPYPGPDNPGIKKLNSERLLRGSDNKPVKVSLLSVRPANRPGLHLANPNIVGNMRMVYSLVREKGKDLVVLDNRGFYNHKEYDTMYADSGAQFKRKR